jgi:type IV secretory pathway VirB2 component (pilin)
MDGIIVSIMSRVRALQGFRLLLSGVTAILTLVAIAAPAGAASANISHAYHSTNTIPNGSIVSLDPNQSDYVVGANTSNGSRLLGVAVASTDSLLAVDPSSSTIQVATSGNANVLVSTLNGDIKVGDQVAVSPFNGLGMKATPGAHVIGLAQSAFSADSDGATTKQVKDKSGKSTALHLGYTRISIAIGTASTASNAPQTSSLQKLAKALTGHTVSTARVIIALVVAIVALAALVTLIYASIYGSIISIGRNPLAKFAIFRTLGSVLGMAALTGLIATLTIYFLLK